LSLRTIIAGAVAAVAISGALALAQTNDAYRPPSDPYRAAPSGQAPYSPPPQQGPQSYYGGQPAPPPPQQGYGQPSYGAPAQGGGQAYGAPPYGGGQGYGGPPPGPAPYGAPPPDGGYGNQAYGQPPPGGGQPYGGPQYGAPYSPPPGEGYGAPPPGPAAYNDGDSHYYSRNEIMNAGHGFFGAVSQGLAGAVEYAFQKAGRPNGYILGEDAGGAFIAGLRYGEGTLFTKDAGNHKVYWQGPSLGYDIGAEGSKTMVLVYHLRDPSDIYNRFGGVQGAAYFVGGVGVQFQQYGDVILAPIRAGLGLRLGANVGYLKYTPAPTWNPF
jgi:hypothetical protein